jgi:signal transduction histidine kinase
VRRQSLLSRVVTLSSAVAVVVGIMIAAALVAILSLRRSETRETRAKDVTTATLRAENLTVNLESALRGYTITRNNVFLTSFYSARAALPGAFRRLEKLLADDRAQLARAHMADQDVQSYLTDYAENMITIASVSPQVARGTVAGAEDRRRSHAIRGLFGTILNVENRRSTQRAAQARSVATVAVVTGTIALALSAIFVLLFGGWVARAVAAPVRRTSAAASRVAAGDFDVRVEEEGAGEIASLVAAFNSMTRALELGRRELLEQNERLRESEEHKRDLISMVSHEIRTPLAAVVGFTSLLLERDFPPDEQQRYLEIVDQQARRLAALAEDFLDVQLLEGGGLTLERARFDLVELTREQANLFFSHDDSHLVDLELPDDPVTVNADRDRMAQVIGNLLSNAIKYSPSGGSVDVVLAVEGERARLSVADQGIGIPPDELPHVFDKFFRGADASAIGGTGLGLAVAREIVSSHGGDIAVDSRPGIGSTFTVDLPVAKSTVAA